MIIDVLEKYFLSNDALKYDSIKLKKSIFVNADNVGVYFPNRFILPEKECLYSYPPWNLCVVKIDVKDYFSLKEKTDVIYVVETNDNNIQCHIFLFGENNKTRYIGYFTLTYNDKKELIKSSLDNIYIPKIDIDPQKSGSMVRDYLMPLLLFCFTFSNCKNVTKKENLYPKNLIKRRARENKVPISKYYTLEIDKKTQDRASRSGIGGWSNSAHICRGHFKHYTQEAPLFGHYVGTVWCPMHLKGDENVGTVKKDYAINISA